MKEFFKNKYVNSVIIILLVLVFIIPYMGVIYYTLPRNDEFACAYGITVQGGYSFKHLMEFVVTNYMEWEGNYSGVFVYTALNPIIIGNSDSTVRIMNMICFFGFIAGWSYILYRCFSFYGMDRKVTGMVTAFGLIMSMNCRFLREMLGWYTGYMYYTLQLLLGLLGLFMVYDLTVKDEKKSLKKTIPVMCAACLFEVIGAGGTLHASAILCFVILLFLVWTIYRKKEWIKAAILFGAIFLSTVVNVIAPGHKVRKEDYESISVFKGAVYTLSCVFNEIRRLCASTFFPYVMLALFIFLMLVIKTGKKRIELHPITVGLCGLACILGSSFPVCYGYAKPDMASRGYEMMDLMIVIWSVLFICSLANELVADGVVLSSGALMSVTLMTVMLIATVGLHNIEFSDIPILQCISGLANGSIKDYSDYWRDVLHQVENSTENDVVIYVDSDHLERECIIDRVMIQEDPTNWVNTSMCTYYGHDTVRIVRVD